MVINQCPTLIIEFDHFANDHLLQSGLQFIRLMFWNVSKLSIQKRLSYSYILRQRETALWIAGQGYSAWIFWKRSTPKNHRILKQGTFVGIVSFICKSVKVRASVKVSIWARASRIGLRGDLDEKGKEILRSKIGRLQLTW